MQNENDDGKGVNTLMYKLSKASVLRPLGNNDGFDLAFPLKIPKWKLASIVVSNFRVVVNYYFWLAQANITTADGNLFCFEKSKVVIRKG